MKKCIICGKEFESHKHNHQMCSDFCRKVRKSRQQCEYRKINKTKIEEKQNEN